jgi:hypothetical protein
MNTFKHFVKVSRIKPESLRREELKSRIYDSVFGVDPRRTIHIELCIGELIQFQNIIEPLPEYNWVIWHENSKSLDLGEYLLPESVETFGRQA